MLINGSKSAVFLPGAGPADRLEVGGA
eukprot:COSAG06_NODE_22726_length_714_cov_2.653659_1_plen_26_part_10